MTPNTNGAFLFTVANTSNATLGFNLAAANNATNPFAPPADNFDPTTLTAVVDAGVLGTYEPGVDVATTIDTGDRGRDLRRVGRGRDPRRSGQRRRLRRSR